MNSAETAGTPGHTTSPTGGGSRLGWALVVISFAQLMIVLDGTIANIALPFIGADLGISQANLTWIVTGYALAFGGLLLLGGRLGDLYGRRRIFILSLVLISGASLLGGLAANEFMLFIARALQGIGAAMVAPAGLALITTTFPAGPPRNRAFAVYAAISGAGAAVGLILGGWLTGLDQIAGMDIEGWRLTFLINVPIGLIGAFAAPRVLAESETHTGKLDIPGAVLGTLGLFGMVFGLSRAGEAAYGWGHWQTIAPLAAGVLLLVAFAVLESRVAHPLLPLRIFTNRTRATSFVTMMVAPAALFALYFYLSLLIQQIGGYSSLQAGFAFVPLAAGIVIGSAVASKLVSKTAPRIVAGTGTLLAAAALFMLSRIDIDDSPGRVVAALAAGETVGAGMNYWTEIFPFIALMSLGTGMMFVPMTLTALYRIEARDSGIGSGVFNTMQQVGGAVGLAALSTVALHATATRANDVTATIAEELAQAGIDPTATTPTGQTMLDAAVFQASFTEGVTQTFLVGAVMMLIASAIIWTFLNVKHTDLATDNHADQMPAES